MNALDLVNPGGFAMEITALSIVSISSLILAAIIAIAAVPFFRNNNATFTRLVAFFLTVSLVAVCFVSLAFDNANQKTDYIAKVTVWINAEYDANITKEQARSLINGATVPSSVDGEFFILNKTDSGDLFLARVIAA